MDHKGFEYTIRQVEHALWKWQFQIGETVTTGSTRTRLMGMAVHRVQQRIDRELKARVRQNALASYPVMTGAATARR
jgi:hypothetical protein